MPKKRVIVVFLDGVGLGDEDPEANPFLYVNMPTVQNLVGAPYLTRKMAGRRSNRAALLGLDAQLTVPGLPQSATGQTTILTGQNAAGALGEHYGPYPNQILRKMLARDSIFKTLLENGEPVAYANAYPTRFLERVQRGKGRLSANTQAAFLAGLKLRSGEDLRRGRAITALLSNDFWPEPTLQLPSLTARQAGEQLVDLAGDHTLTFFEFWYSDLVGHRKARDQAITMLGLLDDFLAGILDRIEDANALLLVISDHGNLEDLTTRKHTTNPALTIVAGAGFSSVATQLHSLVDLKPAILSYLFNRS